MITLSKTEIATQETAATVAALCRICSWIAQRLAELVAHILEAQKVLNAGANVTSLKGNAHVITAQMIGNGMGIISLAERMIMGNMSIVIDRETEVHTDIGKIDTERENKNET